MWGTARKRNLQLMYDARGGDAPGINRDSEGVAGRLPAVRKGV